MAFTPSGLWSTNQNFILPSCLPSFVQWDLRPWWWTVRTKMQMAQSLDRTFRSGLSILSDPSHSSSSSFHPFCILYFVFSSRKSFPLMFFMTKALYSHPAYCPRVEVFSRWLVKFTDFNTKVDSVHLCLYFSLVEAIQTRRQGTWQEARLATHHFGFDIDIHLLRRNWIPIIKWKWFVVEITIKGLATECQSVKEDAFVLLKFP